VLLSGPNDSLLMALSRVTKLVMREVCGDSLTGLSKRLNLLLSFADFKRTYSNLN